MFVCIYVVNIHVQKEISPHLSWLWSRFLSLASAAVRLGFPEAAAAPTASGIALAVDDCPVCGYDTDMQIRSGWFYEYKKKRVASTLDCLLSAEQDGDLLLQISVIE